MKTALRYGAQALLYAAFVAVIGYLSTSPAYQHLAPGEALLKLSLTHAGARKEACRQRSAEELAKLAPNMRAQSVCPRERVPVTVEVTLDDATTRNRGASTIYRRVPVAAGRHRIGARLADNSAGEFTFAHAATVDLAPGRVIVIDFDPAQGGFVFR